jgi:hypothetical protein
LKNAGDVLGIIPVAALASGEILQLPDGRAGYLAGLQAAAIGDLNRGLQVKGRITVPKTADLNFLDGGKVFWDTSASKAHFKKDHGDFYLGRAVGDSLAAATTVVVEMNVDPPEFVDMSDAGSLFLNVLVGSATYVIEAGASARLTMIATNEAEKTDLLSVLACPVARKCILEARVALTAAANATDINIGLANGTHASDFESVTEFCGIHMDGAAAHIYAQSRDGTTTVTVTDTTVDWAADTIFEVWVDCRNSSDIQIYINAVLVLTATVFKLNAATGPLKAVVHCEKSSSTDTAIVRVESLSIRTMDN